MKKPTAAKTAAKTADKPASDTGGQTTSEAGGLKIDPAVTTAATSAIDPSRGVAGGGEVGDAQGRIAVGILAKDDGVRTEHDAHPLDPMYLGTKIYETEGLKQSQEFYKDVQTKAAEQAETSL